jgi:pimeloyl-ACP methyl ester carboxylesterase
MAERGKLELLLLHALPFDGSMWAGQMELLPGQTYAPTLYPFGDRIETWAAEALRLVKGDRLIVVGCSVGGSCALEVAAAAPDRVAALVLIGTKAQHRPDAALHASVLDTLEEEGLEEAWRVFWAPLISDTAAREVIQEAQRIALSQSPHEVLRGVSVFHSRSSGDQVLSTFPGPVIVITGEDDNSPGLKTSAKQAASARNGSLHVVPRCGHYVSLERPEILNSILRDVIADHYS